MFIWCHSVSLAVAFSKISHQHILSKVISKCHIQAHTTANKSVLAGNCTGFIVGSSIGSYYPVPLMTSAVLAQCVTRTSSFNTHTHLVKSPSIKCFHCLGDFCNTFLSTSAAQPILFHNMFLLLLKCCDLSFTLYSRECSWMLAFCGWCMFVPALV